MFDYFQNKYRIDSHRLKGWDYRAPGWYFITICTYQGICYFGEIKNCVMGLSEIGCTVWKFWIEIPTPHMHTKLGEFIVMPNHVHMTIKLTRRKDLNEKPVETLHATSLQRKEQINSMSSISPKSGSISSIIRSFKSAVTKWAHFNDHNNFAWQPGYYDHIFRSPKSLYRINECIWSNPQNWDNDAYHPENKNFNKKTL